MEHRRRQRHIRQGIHRQLWLVGLARLHMTEVEIQTGNGEQAKSSSQQAMYVYANTTTQGHDNLYGNPLQDPVTTHAMLAVVIWTRPMPTGGMDAVAGVGTGAIRDFSGKHKLSTGQASTYSKRDKA